MMDPETMQPVPADGETMGEIMFRGNITMKGYLKNPEATRKAFAGGWFHSGDLAVMQPDGYVKIKDRSKDIIISGGENISSLEVEDVLYRHPAVLAAAVVAMPDAKWGETPCAFVELKTGCDRDRKGNHRVLPRAHGEVQGAARGGVRRAAEDLDRQDPEVRAAREGEVGDRHRFLRNRHERRSSSNSRVLLREDRDGIATLTLNRPAQMNLLTTEMLAALQDAFDSIAERREHPRRRPRGRRQGLLRRPRPEGNPRARRAAEDRRRCSRSAAAMMMTIQGLPQPVIAKVQGAAAAAGCQLVAQCDLAVAVGHGEVRHLRASPGASSARRPASPSAATCSASTRWRCCSPASRSTRSGRSSGGW